MLVTSGSHPDCSVGQMGQQVWPTFNPGFKNTDNNGKGNGAGQPLIVSHVNDGKGKMSYCNR